MPTFLALYQGRTIASARIVAVSADPHIIAYVVEKLLACPNEPEDDPIVRAVDEGRHKALRLMKRGERHGER